MIKHIPRTLLHPSALEVHILSNPVFDGLVVLDLQKLFLDCVNVVKAKGFVQEFECLVEILD